MTSKKLKVENWPIEKLIPYVRNPRKNDHAVEQVAAAIREFGFRVPIVAKSDGLLVDGHLRLKAAQKLGLTEVPVVLADDMTEAQIKAFRISVNRMAELAQWDNELLALEFAELKELGFDTSLTGFDNDMLAEIMPPEKSEPLTDEDAVPEVEDAPVVKRGDTWILGNHRLRCGDSTSAEDVALLMNGEKADMVFTDPPYNIASHAKNHAAKSMLQSRSGRTNYEILAESEWDKNFEITSVFPHIQNNLKTDATCYIATSHFLLADILKWMSESFDYSNVCIWSKPNPMPSLAKRHWTWSHEFVAYGTKGKHIFNFPETGHAFSVWSITKSSKCDLHPTMKPIAIPEHAIVHSSNAGQTVLDLFGGSGSTLIACEKTGRKCFMMELDEKYVQVIIRRWQEYTGKDAYHAETGETFNSLASK